LPPHLHKPASAHCCYWGATGKNFPSDLKTDAQAQTNIKNSVATFSVSANSDLAQLQSLNGTYELKNKALKANYALLIPSLQRLEFFLNRRLNGKIAATGELSHDGKSLFATVNSKVAGGELNGQIAGDEANFKLQNFIVKELTTLLNIDHVYDGTGNANLTYNTSSHSGKFDSIINNGRLPSGGLIDKIGKILGRDLGGEVYNDAKVNGTIKQNLINSIDLFKKELDECENLIKNEKWDELREWMNEARKIREILRREIRRRSL